MSGSWQWLAAVLAVVGLALAGCGRGDGLLEDYPRRIEAAAALPAQAAPPPPLLRYPSHRQRALPVQDLRVGLMDYLGYRHCGLVTLLSERNSILGKVMPGSQRLVYEVRFLQGIRGCAARLADQPQADPGFRTGLEATLRVKEANLARVFWAATFDSPEMEKAFSLAVEPLAPGEEGGFAASRQALDYFTAVGRRLHDPRLTLDIGELEAHNFALQAHRYGGRLLTTLARLTAALDRAAAALEAAAQDGPACPDHRTGEPDPLHNVFASHYAGGMQPYLSRIHSQGRDWLAAVDRLWQVQAVAPPPAVAAWQRRMLSLEAGDGLWRTFEAAIRRHSGAWRRLLEPCGALAPGGQPGAGNGPGRGVEDAVLDLHLGALRQPGEELGQGDAAAGVLDGDGAGRVDGDAEDGEAGIGNDVARRPAQQQAVGAALIPHLGGEGPAVAVGKAPHLHLPLPGQTAADHPVGIVGQGAGQNLDAENLQAAARGHGGG
ncbi:MAG: DUF3080 domain-containing protein, partial [Pseudomonadota bacterium]|nr:DUF3080 domain-containing protein [Pseudomonadota bacterium]